MSDEALEALLGGENLEMGDLTGVPVVTGDEVVEQLTGEKPEEEEQVEEGSSSPDEPEAEKSNGFLDAMDAVDIDADGAYGLQVNMQDADGNPVIKTVGELKDAFETANQTNLKRETTENELATRQAELQEQEASFRTVQSELLQMPQQLAEVESKIMAADMYIQQNEAELSQVNPGQLALAKQELLSLQLTRNNLQTAQYNSREALQSSIRQEQVIKQNQRLQAQTDKMLEMIPEWSNPEVRNTQTQDLIKYGMEHGFSQQEMTTIDNPHTVKYLREQMLKDQKLAAVVPNSDVPKPLKPQAVKNKTTAERAAYNKLIKKATDSNDRRDKLDGIVALMNQ